MSTQGHDTGSQIYGVNSASDKDCSPTGVFGWIKKNSGIVLIIAMFVLWRLYFMTRNHDVIWDEAVYLGIGKHLWSLGHAGLWEIIRPLGLSFLLGGIWKIGLDQIVWGEVLAIFFSAGCLYLTYLIGERVHSKPAGAVAALLLGMTPTFFLYSGYIMTDIPSVFFMLVSILLFLHNAYAWSGFSASLAFMFRYPHGLIMASIGATIFLYYLVDRTNTSKSQDLSSHFSRFVGGCVGIPLVYMVVNWFLYHTETSRAWHAIFRPWIFAAWHAGNPAEAAGGYLYYMYGILAENPLLILCVLGLVWFVLNKEYKNQNQTVLWISLVMYGFYFSVIINKQLRFAIAFLPLLAILSGKGLIETIDWIGCSSSRKKMLRWIAIIGVLAYLWLFLYPEDMKFYGWRYASPQPVVSEVYQYFGRPGINKPVLTADPLPAAYTSGRFEPLYFSVDSGGRMYDQHIAKAWGVLFVPEAFFCEKGDATCVQGIVGLQERIKQDNDLVFEKRFGREDLGFRTYQLWKKKVYVLPLASR